MTLRMTQSRTRCYPYFTQMIIYALISVRKKIQWIPSFGPYMPLGLTQSSPNCYPYFTQMIIYELISVMKKIVRDYLFWVVDSPWDDKITSTLLSILHPTNQPWSIFNNKNLLMGPNDQEDHNSIKSEDQ